VSTFDGSSGARVRESLERALAFTEKLLAENARLRKSLAASHSGGSGDVLLASRLQHAEAEIARLRQAEATRAATAPAPVEAGKLAELERELADLRSRHRLLEEQNNNLANLYVASHQLHSTLDFKEVVAIVMEIVTNLIGAESFAIHLVDQNTKALHVIAAEGMDGSLLPPTPLGEGPVGAPAATGRPWVLQGVQPIAVDPAQPVGVIPLKLKDQVIGAISVWKLLPQKRGGFSALDHQLFELLGGHAATAIFTSKLYGDNERKLTTIQGFLDLLTAS
jgi:hypothetical protein